MIEPPTLILERAATRYTAQVIIAPDDICTNMVPYKVPWHRRTPSAPYDCLGGLHELYYCLDDCKLLLFLLLLFKVDVCNSYLYHSCFYQSCLYNLNSTLTLLARLLCLLDVKLHGGY